MVTAVDRPRSRTFTPPGITWVEIAGLRAELTPDVLAVELHLPADEPAAPRLSAFDFAFENEDLPIERIQDMIYEEILLYHFPSKKREYEALKRTYDEANPRSEAPFEEVSDEDS